MTGASRTTSWCRPPKRAARRRARSSRSISSRSRAAMRSRSDASPRCSATTPIPGMEIEIAVRKFDLPHEFSKSGRWRRRRPSPKTVREEDIRGRKDLRELRFVTIDGETARDFDDAVYCKRERRKAGLSPVGGDRRRQPLRAPRRRARPGGARARHLGLFPAPRDPDAAGEALQRHLLAQSERRSPRHGVRDGDRARRARWRATSSIRAVFRSPARLTYTEVWAGALRRARRPRTCRHLYDAVQGAARRAQPARRDRLRDRRDAHAVRRRRARSSASWPSRATTRTA